jgi:translation initiation factor IF-3
MERGLDLIEVAPNGRPPVCRIADYGQLKYEKKKRDNAARKNQVQVQLKEVKLRPKTDGHDIAVKIRNARRFLEAGDKVKVTVRFRGREMAHRDIGAQRCLALAEALSAVGAIESHPRMDGRQMFMILAPTRRPVAKPEVADDGTLTRAQRRALEASRRAKGETTEEIERAAAAGELPDLEPIGDEHEYDPDDDISDDEFDEMDDDEDDSGTADDASADDASADDKPEGESKG